MKKLKFTILLLLFFMAGAVSAQQAQVIRNYIEQYREIAIVEMLRSGVPASITLAQGIHESAAGTSNLVRRSNNHFGIKCKSEWKGEWVSHDDDAKGECFRKYADPLESYRDHSDFLKYRPHYAFLFKLDPTDYEGWAHGLKKAGYATNPKYPQVLIKLIKDYNLNEYTLIALNRQSGNGADWASETTEAATAAKPSFAAEKKPRKTYPAGVFTINKTKVVFVEEGTSFMKIADEHHLSLARLFEFNDMSPRDIADKDQLVFLQRKRKIGEQEYHLVQPGESLHEIAQERGIRLESLMEYNRLTGKMQPAAGEKLFLTTHAEAAPRLTVAQKLNDLFTASKNVFKKEETAATIHVVRPKETLFSIARQYEMEVDELKKMNQLQSTEISIGQELKVKKITADAPDKSSR